MHGLRKAKGTAAGATLLLAAALSACSGGSGAAPSPAPPVVGDAIPAPSPFPQVAPPDPKTCAKVSTAGANDPGWKDTWGIWGVKAPPPHELVASTGANPTIKNLTKGAVSDRDADLWGGALARSLDIIKWTEANLETDFYSSALNPVADGPKAYAGLPPGYAQLRADGAYFHCFDDNTRVAAYNLVHLAAAAPGSSEYAFVLQEQLGFKDLFLYSDGHTIPVWGPLSQRDPQAKLRVVAGRYTHHPILGDVWYVTRDQLCTRRDDPADPCRAYGIAALG
ncbi:MAG: hypothetical protein QOK05_2959 [Chloroflexota bacterium]|jgi:hypothetical protein|nr:hypothetical protein [Chloroflexota bacterium]